MPQLISVIVPIYKVEAYLGKCVESILNQTYANLEIILVDDGSPDGCGRICDGYAEKDSRVTVIHKENGGISSARNAGLDICKGAYISFVDSDDFISPYFIEVLYNSLRTTGSEIASVMRGVDFTDAGEGEVQLIRNAADCSVTAVTSREAIRRMMYQRIPNGAPWRLYDRRVFETVRFPENCIFEDAATTHRAFMGAERIALTDAPIYAYRHRPGSIIRSAFTPSKLDCIPVSRQLVADIHAYDPTLDIAAASRAFSMNYHVFIQVPRSDRASMKKLWTEMLRYRGAVVRDRAREVRPKNRIGAWCAYLGMDVAYTIGRLYKSMDREKG